MSKQASNNDLEKYLCSRPQAGYDIYGSRARAEPGGVGVPDLTEYLLDRGAGGAPLTAKTVVGWVAWSVIVFQYVQFCLILYYVLVVWLYTGFNPYAPFWGLLDYGGAYLRECGMILIVELPITFLAFIWLVVHNED